MDAVRPGERAIVAPREAGRSPGHAIVMGDDLVAIVICERLQEFENDGCVLLGPHAPEARAAAERAGTRFVPGDPAIAQTLVLAGIAQARSLLLLSADDRLNLKVALTARDLRPDIRIVMRQFNRALGRKLEAKMPNTSVVSIAAQTGAIFAAATVDASNYYGVQFPDRDGPLFGFAERTASTLDVADETVADAERRLGMRILTVAGVAASARRKIAGGDVLATFARVDPHARNAKRRHRAGGVSVARGFGRVRNAWRRADPLARRLIVSALVFFVCATAYFVGTLHTDPMTAAYFVLTTMTTTGYGDIVPHATDHFEQLAAMITMLAGVVLTGLFVALVAANFTQARYRAQQGLRRIAASDHVIVCGAGRVGARVVDYLLALGCEVVVVEREPTADIVERAREREFSLLTGDATADATLAFCNVTEARAIVALTESDTMNLEVVLGAQAINPNLPAVMRVLEGDFARKIARHFNLDRTFGAADLMSPVLAGLSFAPGVRGFVTVSGREYGLSQIDLADAERVANLLTIEGTVPLAAWCAGEARTIASFGELTPRDEFALYLYPSYRFRKDASGALARDMDGIA